MIQKLDAVVKDGGLKFSKPIEGLSNGQRVRVLIAPVIDKADFKGLSDEAREQLFLQWMDQQALFEDSDEPPIPPMEMEDFEPIHIKGPPLSQTILEDRN